MSNFSSNPCSCHTSFKSVTQLLDGSGSGSEIPKHNVESENTRAFILIHFAADHAATFFSPPFWKTPKSLVAQHGHSTPPNSAIPSLLYASLRSISVCDWSLQGLSQTGVLVVHRHSFELLVIFA